MRQQPPWWTHACPICTLSSSCTRWLIIPRLSLRPQTTPLSDPYQAQDLDRTEASRACPGPCLGTLLCCAYHVTETQLTLTDLPLNTTCLSETSALKQNSYLNWIPLNMTCLNKTSGLKQNSYLNFNQNSTDCLIIWCTYIGHSPWLVSVE